jgi:hypothetical protein
MKLLTIILGIPFGILFCLMAVLAAIWVVVFLFFAFLIRLVVILLVWVLWLPAGKDVLFVYSESPNWEEYLQSKVIPKVEHRAHLLNWSERKKWRVWKSMPVLVFHLFAGQRNMNPMALCFRFARWPKAFRFLQPLEDFKHGDDGALLRMLEDFYDYIALSESEKGF